MVDDPIVVIYNEDIGDPVYFEAHDIDWRDPDTPPSGIARGLKKKTRKTKKRPKRRATKKKRISRKRT